MNTDVSRPSRRQIISASTSIGALYVMASAGFPEPAAAAAVPDTPTAGGEALRPLHIHFPDEALADLRRRVVTTRWPSREVVTNDTQGAQLATLQTLARRWGTAYDWRRCEARLNAVPQFLTAIDGIDIHFIQVRSHHGLDVNRQCAAKGQLRPHFPGRGARTIRLH